MSEASIPLFGGGMAKGQVEELRKLLHSNLDHMFDELEFDSEGLLINELNLDQKRDFEGIAFSGNEKVFITKSKTMSITVGETLNGLQKQVNEAIARATAKKGAGR